MQVFDPILPTKPAGQKYWYVYLELVPNSFYFQIKKKKIDFVPGRRVLYSFF